MNKKELIAKLAEKMGTSKKAAEENLTVVAEVITEALQAGQSVKIPGVGTFSVVDVAERTGTIQMGEKKGEKYVTPAHRAPRFKAVNALKDAVR